MTVVDVMKPSKQTLVASGVGTLVGCVLAQIGIGERVWPAHPVLFVVMITLWVTIVSEVWAEREAKE